MPLFGRSFSRNIFAYLFVSLTLNVALQIQALGDTPPWIFASSPDMFNSDVADLSGQTPGVPAAAGWQEGMANGISPEMILAYDKFVAEIASHSPDLFMVSGDLINGRWSGDNTLDLFKNPGDSTFQAIQNAANIYYKYYRNLFERNGIPIILGAIGDHEIGDNDWKVGGERSKQVGDLKIAFYNGMVAPLNLPDQIFGIPSRPIGTDYKNGSYAYIHKNILFLTIDVFQFEGADEFLHLRTGSVAGNVEGDHLSWIDKILSASSRDDRIDHVIVQGHTPILPGVRKQASSGMMLVDREDSEFWKVLRSHSHQQGGKVRFYFGGEVHTVTATKDQASDIIQLVHGNPPVGRGGTNYVIFTVKSNRIDAKLYRSDLIGQSPYWQPSGGKNNPRKNNSYGPVEITPGDLTGILSIDTRNKVTHVKAEGDLALVDYRGLLIHFDFDKFSGNKIYKNTGSLGGLYYDGETRGNLGLVAGRLGKGVFFNGRNGHVRSGLTPMSEGEERSITAWIKTSASGSRTIMGSGMDRGVANSIFNLVVENGALGVRIDGGKENHVILAKNAPLVNDNQWHHVAVTLNGGHDGDTSQLMFYIDGQDFDPVVNGESILLYTYPGFKSHVYIGQSNESKGATFSGVIDDVGYWGRALRPEAIRALVSMSDPAVLGYNSAQVEEILSVFWGYKKSVLINNLVWSRSEGLEANPGILRVLPANSYELALDEHGIGVIAKPMDSTLTFPQSDGRR